MIKIKHSVQCDDCGKETSIFILPEEYDDAIAIIKRTIKVFEWQIENEENMIACEHYCPECCKD